MISGYPQQTIIDNYNVFAEHAAKKNLKILPLNKAGLCTGLTRNYLFYAKQLRRDEFYSYLDFAESLTDKNEIKRLIDRYLEAKNADKELIIQNANGETFSANKFIQFLEGINLAQFDPNHKTIMANLDKVFSTVCDKSMLAQRLKDAEIANGNLMYVSLGLHCFAIEKVADGYYIFESNKIMRKNKLLKNEEEVAQQIIENISITGFPTTSKNIAFSIDFLSYGDVNRELDDAIAEEEATMANYPSLMSLIKSYPNVRVSRLDLALALNAELEALIPPAFELVSFQHKVKECIEKLDVSQYRQKVNTIIEQDNNCLLEGDGQVTWLFLATFGNQISIIKKLIDKKANLNSQDSYYGSTSLLEAAMSGHTEIAKLLLAAGADPNIPNKKGVYPLHAAIERGHLEIVKALLQQKNINVNVVDKDEKATPLDIAIEKNDLDLINALLAKGANLEYCDLSHINLNNLNFFGNELSLDAKTINLTLTRIAKQIQNPKQENALKRVVINQLDQATRNNPERQAILDAAYHHPLFNNFFRNIMGFFRPNPDIENKKLIHDLFQATESKQPLR